MRGYSEPQLMIIAYIDLKKRVIQDHPLRKVKVLADQELKRLSPLFNKMYSHAGRPSIPPERILKSLLLIALYSIRSERQFCEQMDYNLLYRWFLNIELNDVGFDPTVFTKNRERLMEHEVGKLFFDGVVRQARATGLMSDDHFTVDGTLIEAWASLKSFGPKEALSEESCILRSRRSGVPDGHRSSGLWSGARFERVEGGGDICISGWGEKYLGSA